LKLLLAHNLHKTPIMLTRLFSRNPSPGVALVRSVLLSLLGMSVVFASLRLAMWQATVVPALVVTGILLTVMLVSMVPRWRSRWAAAQQLPAE
jgi:hypothetical protein